MLQANQKNYRKAYHKHRLSYYNWEKGCGISRRLILCYCVECGLKCLIMQNNRINSVAQANEQIVHILRSHDFRILLKAVKQAGNYSFKEFKTEYGDNVNTKNFHELCRYAIEADKKELPQIKEYEEKLTKIIEWLEEMI